MRIFSNGVAVITGAGSGIGRALANELASRGTHLALCDVNAAGLEETAAGIPSGIRVLTQIVDVSKRSEMEAFAQAVIAEFGRVTILINNAGVALHGTIDELSLEDYEWIVGINLWGPVYGTKLFLPHLQAQPEAHLVIVSSVFGLMAPAGHTGYSLAKFGVRGFGEALRAEFHGSKLGVTVVHPGGIATNIARATRAGAHADASEVARSAALFDERLARTTPGTAAKKIVRGIEKRKSRVLIGGDARLLDTIVRAFPTAFDYLASTAMQERRRDRAEKDMAKAAAHASRKLAKTRA